MSQRFTKQRPLNEAEKQERINELVNSGAESLTPKKKVGRPKGSVAIKKLGNTVSVGFNEEDYARLKEHCYTEGLTVAMFLRQLALRALRNNN